MLRPAIVFLAVALAVTGCASNKAVPAGFVANPGDLQPEPGKGERMLTQRPDPDVLARFDAVQVETVRFYGTAAEVRARNPEKVDEVARLLEAELRDQLAREYNVLPVSDRRTNALTVRVGITGVTKANVGVNALTSALVGPFKNGGLKAEAEVLDPAGRRVAALVWAKSGGLGQFFGNFASLSHARSGARAFARDIAELIDRKPASLDEGKVR